MTIQVSKQIDPNQTLSFYQFIFRYFIMKQHVKWEIWWYFRTALPCAAFILVRNDICFLKPEEIESHSPSIHNFLWQTIKFNLTKIHNQNALNGHFYLPGWVFLFQRNQREHCSHASLSNCTNEWRDIFYCIVSHTNYSW